ncbi:MAG: 23S rRNA (pseudouridine(1915)-N(3))-methyltransferase RlmH [Lachnospiraceae bacterium]|nr:23S rRNA (pseudouridine(1915)-N(3))-methyltransferase RlmH [Lachnospiraceae bacterium]
MKIRILCVGKIKEDFYRKKLEEYSKQINKQYTFEIIEVEDEKTQEQLSDVERDKILRIEGERLLKYLKQETGDYVVALCINGRKYTTAEWTEVLKKRILQQEYRQVTYVIGGSLGLDASVVKLADTKLSFSDLTFPHQLMRVILAEQILTCSI